MVHGCWEDPGSKQGELRSCSYHWSGGLQADSKVMAGEEADPVTSAGCAQERQDVWLLELPLSHLKTSLSLMWSTPWASTDQLLAVTAAESCLTLQSCPMKLQVARPRGLYLFDSHPGHSSQSRAWHTAGAH